MVNEARSVLAQLQRGRAGGARKRWLRLVIPTNPSRLQRGRAGGARKSEAKSNLAGSGRSASTGAWGVGYGADAGGCNGAGAGGRGKGGVGIPVRRAGGMLQRGRAGGARKSAGAMAGTPHTCHASTGPRRGGAEKPAV